MSRIFQHQIELVEDDVLSGWVIDPEWPGRSCRVQIAVDGRTVATLLAADLVDRRLMSGLHIRPEHPDYERLGQRVNFAAGFNYRIPTSIARGADHKLEITAMSGPKSSVIFEAGVNLAETTLAALRAIFADFRFFTVEQVERLADQRIAFSGWCSVPSGEPAMAAVAINGQPADIALETAASPPDPMHFTFWPDRPVFSFRGECDLASAPASDRGYRFTGVNASNERCFPASQDYYLPAYWRECLDEWPVPPVDAIGRVAPWAARRAEAEGEAFVRSAYFFAGYTDLWHVADVVMAHVGRATGDMEAVLDWGCGCGRLTQHLGRHGVAAPAGADIDPDNLAWCRANISDVRFDELALDPPSPYADNSLDLVIGLSVFTHLTEADQFAWLAELRRILKPGGILAVSVAGHHALKRAGLGQAIQFHRSTRKRGFADDNIGNLFNDLLADRSAYYRNARHLPHYVREKWSGDFEILAIEPGAMAGQQDLVIGRKRS